MEIKAAVLRRADAPYSLETVHLAEPGRDEVLIRIVGAGMCHTDMVWRQPGFGELPVILGHEGAGVVEELGPGVDGLNVGDHVVLTFDSCGHCSNCFAAHPAYCDTFWLRNLTGRDVKGRTPVRDAHGEEVSARWFQQSSFATHTVAAVRNTVKVPDELPLHLLGPLGCGVLTGAGAVFNTLEVVPGNGFLVLGVGAVGLSAVMAARIAGADPIIAFDRHASRLELARDLGATHTISHGGDDLTKQISAACTRGVRAALDTTGAPSVISAAIGGLSPRGVLGMVGAQTGNLVLAPMDLAVGRTLTGILEGDAVPQRLIPLLIRLWQQGRFPFDKLIEVYPLSDIDKAESASRSGDVVKPVLLPG